MLGCVRTRPRLRLSVGACRRAYRGGWGRGGVHTVSRLIRVNDKNEPHWGTGAFAAAHVSGSATSGPARRFTLCSILGLGWV
jgi:hypothetical protein